MNKELPKVVADYIKSEESSGRVSFKNKPSDDLMFDGFICVPGHNYDLHESNLKTHEINLVLIKTIDLLGAPYCNIYEKQNKDEPAYLIVRCYEHPVDYYWFEF